VGTCVRAWPGRTVLLSACVDLQDSSWSLGISRPEAGLAWSWPSVNGNNLGRHFFPGTY
jgi:hypothetical protein